MIEERESYFPQISIKDSDFSLTTLKAIEHASKLALREVIYLTIRLIPICQLDEPPQGDEIPLGESLAVDVDRG
jgi:hypothetical protein